MARKGKSERSRHERKRAQKPTILIVVEGETEKLYFGDIKRRFRARWIEVEKPSRNDPKNLVLAARRKKQEMERNEGLSVEPWVVFDAEAREDEEARSYGEAIKQAEGWGIHVANSSPCLSTGPYCTTHRAFSSRHRSKQSPNSRNPAEPRITRNPAFPLTNSGGFS